MNTNLTVFLAITGVAAYLLGGINGAIIASLNLFKKDVRNFGSGNAGLTNFTRTFGGRGVAIVLLVDIIKTIIAVLIGRWLVGMAGYPTIGMLFAGFCTMLGHAYPIYYRFHGGKTVLCAGTLVWMIDWRIGLICWTVFVVTVVFTRYVSLGAMLGASFFPIGLLVFRYTWLEVVIGLLCAALLVYSHRENIKRLRSGSESKLNLGGKPKNG